MCVFVCACVLRQEIRKGLNVLNKEVPGGDTFMHLGLEKVGLGQLAYH